MPPMGVQVPGLVTQLLECAQHKRHSVCFLVLCPAEFEATIQAQVDECISKVALSLFNNLAECLEHMGYTHEETMAMVEGKQRPAPVFDLSFLCHSTNLTS